MPAASPNIPFPPEQPRLIWKPSLLHEKPLEPASKPTFSATLKEAFAIADHRKGKIVLVTRMSDGWGVFKYKGNMFCKVDFDNIQLGGLPLGGNPLNPNTYIINSRGQIARIVHVEDRYRLEMIAKPTHEPTEPWVPALVPIEEHNDGYGLIWLPKFAFRPTPDDLQLTLGWIDRNMPDETKVKAGGAQHAWSKIAITSSVYILPHGLKLYRFLSEEPKTYRDDLGERFSNLVRLGSGVKIREANRYLWEKGKSFPLLGGYDGQTMGGVFNTGTHGSVLTFGPLAEMIVSIELVLPNGGLLRIEPTDGITDPDALATERPDITLRQDDDYFYAALINMGTMGVVHSYVLEVTDSFHLKEVRTSTTVEGMKEVLKGGKIYDIVGIQGKPADMAKVRPRISDGKDGGFKGHFYPAYHLELLYNPHGKKIVVTSRYPVTVKDDSIFSFEPPGRDLIRTLLLPTRFHRPLIPTWIQERWRGVLVTIVDTLIKLFPKMIPSLLDDGMDSLIKKVYIDRSFNVFNIGEGQSRIPAFAGTIFVPLENDKYIDALDIIHDVCNEFAGRNLYETAPASMRFMKATRAMLGCPKDYCGFECIFTASTQYTQEMIDAFDLALRKKFGDEVRTHWGQLMRDPDEEQIRGMYHQYDRWRTIRDELDPKARFLNEWQTKILPPARP